MYVETVLAAKVIRKALKSKAPTLSVRIGRGTASGWIDVWGSGDCNMFTEQEKQALREVGMNFGGNCAVISPESREYWVKKLTDLVPEAKVLLISELLLEDEKWS